MYDGLVVGLAPGGLLERRPGCVKRPLEGDEETGLGEDAEEMSAEGGLQRGRPVRDAPPQRTGMGLVEKRSAERT